MQILTIAILFLLALAGVVFLLLPPRRKKDRKTPLKPIANSARKRKTRRRHKTGITAH